MSYPRPPLQPTGALKDFKSFLVTPNIGTEFPDASLCEWFNSPQSDELLRELAITISRRGVVFFRAQDDFTDEMQKKFIQRLGELTGKPKESTLHIHAQHVKPIDKDQVLQIQPDGSDQSVLVINSELNKTLLKGTTYDPALQLRQTSRIHWHNDISYEPFPSDYMCLKMALAPSTGGDTVWASGYEVYDRISKPVQKFLEGLTAGFGEIRQRDASDPRFQLPRGHPENTGANMSPTHPVVRTNPVTGWKSLFAVGNHVKQIHGLHEDESKKLQRWFQQIIVENHDLQCRLRWNSRNDVAIWDNRSTFHAATYDTDGWGAEGVREGHRVCGIGERPYFDPNSPTRREAWAQEEGFGVTGSGPGIRSSVPAYM